MSIKYSIVLGSAIEDVSADRMYLVNYVWYSEEDLELVPEEPEFKYGEVIEVSNDCGETRRERIFMCRIPGDIERPYICIHRGSEEMHNNLSNFLVARRKEARKL